MGAIFRMRGRGRLLAAAVTMAGVFIGQSALAQGTIKIGLLAPVTGPLATSGKDMVDAWKLYWDEAKHEAGGRKVEYVIADTTCNPDQALT